MIRIETIYYSLGNGWPHFWSTLTMPVSSIRQSRSESIWTKTPPVGYWFKRYSFAVYRRISSSTINNGYPRKFGASRIISHVLPCQILVAVKRLNSIDARCCVSGRILRPALLLLSVMMSSVRTKVFSSVNTVHWSIKWSCYFLEAFMNHWNGTSTKSIVPKRISFNYEWN